MTNKEAIDRLTCLKLSYKIRIEEEDIEALEQGIEALEKQKTGKWIDYGERYDVRCSICNTQCSLKPISSSRLMVCKSDYCSGCGAKMKGE